MPPIALTCAWAASWSAAPSIDAPITSALSMALRTSLAEAPPGFFKAKSELQSMSPRRGYAAVDSVLAASAISAPDTLDVTAVGVMGCAFTTSLKSMSAAYAAFASASFTVDIKYVGTSELTTPEKALYTSITLLSGTEAIIRPSAALMASKSACDVTPLPALPMALWCAMTPALSSFESIAAPMSMAVAMALVMSAAEADPGFVRARPE